MKIISQTLEFQIEEPCVLSLGKFDGLHEGHRYLMDAMEPEGEERLAKVLFTFDISPKAFQIENYKTLLTRKEREYVFDQADVDYLIECPFDGAIRNMSPYEFLVFLTKRLNVKRIVVGTDFRFGHMRTGSYTDLKKYESEFGYETAVVNKKQYEGADISSSRIREALLQGDLKLVNTLLGFPFFVEGTVIYGNQIGRTVSIPTANILPAPDKVLPPLGVYRVEVLINGNNYCGIANVGKKPSIEGKYPIGIETHIFDFDQNIYEKEIMVSFLEFIRPERKFDSLDALVQQMNIDIQVCKEAFLKEEK